MSVVCVYVLCSNCMAKFSCAHAKAIASSYTVWCKYWILMISIDDGKVSHNSRFLHHFQPTCLNGCLGPHTASGIHFTYYGGHVIHGYTIVPDFRWTKFCPICLPQGHHRLYVHVNIIMRQKFIPWRGWGQKWQYFSPGKISSYTVTNLLCRLSWCSWSHVPDEGERHIRRRGWRGGGWGVRRSRDAGDRPFSKGRGRIFTAGHSRHQRRPTQGEQMEKYMYM